jgi:4-hydroxy-tetrahydrodipicolinate synthase
MIQLHGAGVAMVTPFRKDESVDFESLKKLTEHMIGNGMDYLVVLGTTGETATLDKKEKTEIHARIKEWNNGRIPYVAGIGGNNTRELQENIRSFDFDGVGALLSVCPYYNKPNQPGIIQHYTAVADTSPVPVILYNVPGRTGVNMTAETTLKLAEHPNIIGMKEASGNFEQCMSIGKYKPENFYLISGDDAITLPLLSTGMDGVISVIANAYPRDFSDMVRLALRGDYRQARLLHYRLLELMTTIFADGSPGGIKEVLHYLELCEPVLRLPMAGVNDQVKDKLIRLATAYKNGIQTA